ncbi:hypothetical protein [Nocardia abscessus]|uniref:hypothetical protein n=1 Tax=Nocardia abscessus TaxID=120957 RepID=UPI001D14BB04|nr:hypothetical protein [Nocardia abscessus]MCC3333625.1 hypothetical protein [Nocardia abscessus]
MRCATAGSFLRDQKSQLRKPRRLEPTSLVPPAQRRSRVVHRSLDTTGSTRSRQAAPATASACRRRCPRRC